LWWLYLIGVFLERVVTMMEKKKKELTKRSNSTSRLSGLFKNIIGAAFLTFFLFFSVFFSREEVEAGCHCSGG
jgi:hypothetical protein